MDGVIELVVYLGLPLLLLVTAQLIGGAVESAHFRYLERRERALSGILVSDMKRLPSSWQASDPAVVVGEAVIATDYAKVFIAALRNLFGGPVPGYERLVNRARRQAIVRMLDQARQQGANVVWNVRVETSTIQGKSEGKSGGVEVIAYGTAMKAAARS